MVHILLSVLTQYNQREKTPSSLSEKSNVAKTTTVEPLVVVLLCIRGLCSSGTLECVKVELGRDISYGGLALLGSV